MNPINPKTLPTIVFDGIRAGNGEATFVIAEIGLNHDGDLDKAKALIRSAAAGGANAVKFQTYVTEKRVPKDSPIHSILKQCELDESGHKELIQVAKKEKISFFSTPFDDGSADLLQQLGVGFFKVASFYMTNAPFLEHLAKKGLPVIVSRGMAEENEIDAAVAIFRRENTPFALLHCISSYPTQPADVNLRVIGTIARKYGCVTGYSDHTMGIEAPILAVAAGASIIEKHYTYDKQARGPDHAMSADPGELKRMVDGIRRAEELLGTPDIRRMDAEKAYLQYRSIPK